MHQLSRVRRGISGIVAAAFLLTIIAIFIALFIASMANLDEMNRAYINYLNERSRVLAAIQAISGLYSIESDYLVINITNSYSETIRIIAIGIVYANAQHDILSENTSTTTALAMLCSPMNTCSSIDLKLPYNLQTGYTLSLRITPRSTDIVSISATTSISTSVISIPIKPYRLTTIPTPTITPNYEIRYIDTVFQGYSVAVRGYRIITEDYAPSEVTTLIGIGIGDVDDLVERDGETYDVIPTIHIRWSRWIGWPYYREIVISNNVDVDLIDYQVRIVLTSNNFDTWDNIARGNGEDLRFIDEDGNELPYWIEYFNKGEKLGIIWVKIPYIPASSTTKIYMLYGNPSAQSHSDGDAVFEFFDDFKEEELNDNVWSYTYNTAESIIKIFKREYLKVRAKYTDQFQFVNVYTKNTWTVPDTYGYIVDTKLSPRSEHPHHYKYYHIARLDLYTANSNINQHPLYAQGAYIHAWDYEGTWIWYFTPNEVKNGTWSNGVDKSFNKNEWYVVSIGYFGNRTYYYIWNVNNYSSPYAYKIYKEMHNDFRIVLGNERSNETDRGAKWQETWYDWVRVRKFVYPDPQISIGEERLIISHRASILISWSNLPPKYLKFINISLVIESVFTNAVFILQHNASGTWSTVLEKTIETNTDINEIGISYEMVTTDLGVVVTIECFGGFIARIDYISINLEVEKRPSIYVLSNELDKLWIYDINQDLWLSIDTQLTSINYPAMYYDESMQILWIANNQDLYIYDSASSKLLKLDANLPISTSYGSMLVIINDKIWYGPGGNSSVLYVSGVRGTSWSDTLMPEALNHYSCVEYNGTHILINFGSSDKFYAFSPITEEWIKLEKSPTIYCVGSAWDSDENILWIIGRGGTIHYYDPRNNQWRPLEMQPPYYPQTEGDRLLYYNNYLYHIRSDGTRELWIIETK